MLSDENFDNGVSNFSFENLASIEIIGMVKVDNNLYGRLDTLVTKYYNGEMKYYQLLLDFNRISNPIDVKIGQIIILPDISEFENSININPILDDNLIPGINSSTEYIENTGKKKDTSKTKTTALPKLKITVDKVTYDSATGILKL